MKFSTPSTTLPLFGLLLATGPVALSQTNAEPVSLPDLIVDSNPLRRTLFEQAQPVSVLEGDALQLSLEPTLGETLSKTPGVRSSYFGPGASRPVIRGLDADRIRILQNGLNTIDASATSVDHAVSFDPVSVSKIEIVRGPATVIYGSNAIGGLVNVIDGRIPDQKIEAPVQGSIGTRYSSVNEGIGGDFQLEGGVGGFAWHLEGYKRQNDNLSIPGYARSSRERAANPLAPDETEERGEIENTYLNTEGFSSGGSYIWEKGYFGLAYSGFDTDYGSPVEKEVSIDLEQRRWDFHGAFYEPVQGLKEIRYRFATSDYEHTEFEGDEAGTTFTNQGYDGRLEFTHEKWGPIEGVFGYQTERSDFEAAGDESFLPEVLTNSHSAFLFEELELNDKVRFQGGLRYDHITVEAKPFDVFDSRERDFDNLSGSLGVIYTPNEDYAIALSSAWSERAPTYQELYAFGPHVATDSYEIGDDGLKSEQVAGLDLSLRKRTGWVTGSVTGFYNHFNRFIGQFPNGTQDTDGRDVYEYRSTKAEFFGAELEATVHLFGPVEAPAAENAEPVSVEDRLDLELKADYVQANDKETGDSLPRISPFHLSAALDYQRGAFGARVESIFSARQNETAEDELPTDSYIMFNAALTYRLASGPVTTDFYIKGVNLTDEEAREHTSFLKDVVPLSGRGLVAGVKMAF